ncbi:MAG: MFS transporter [Dehalococcoidales bacterium]|nr:MAG: MFS transporter [Dehalococcoidales bacterium]
MKERIKRVLTLFTQSGIWSRNLVVLAVAVFLLSLGSGLQNGINTNFMQELGLTDSQVLLQAGIREIPGLGLMFIAALVMHLSLTWRAIVSVAIMGAGVALYASVHSWTALVVMSLMASLGFHLWMPLNNALGLGLASKENAGKVLGTLASVAALASMAGIGSIMVLTQWFSLRVMAGIAGVLIFTAAIVLMRLPKNIGETEKAQPRLLFRWRYWLYYVLLLFEGSRTQVFSAFNIMVLVYNYSLSALQISFLLLASGLVNFLLTPRIGRLLDVLGERTTLTVGYVALALCFVGYALVDNVWFLCVMVIFINLLVTLSIGLSTYVNRIAPPEELTPTLSTGISVNHITSVGMSFLAGFLLPVVGYKALCWGVVVIVLLSVPFTLAMRTQSLQLVSSEEE